MKKIMIKAVALSIIVLTTTACGNTPQARDTQVQSQTNSTQSSTELIDAWVWDDFTWGVGIFHINADNTGSFIIEGTVQYTFTWETPETGIFSMYTALWGLEVFRYSINDGIFIIEDVHSDEVHRYMREAYFNAGRQF